MLCRCDLFVCLFFSSVLDCGYHAGLSTFAAIAMLLLRIALEPCDFLHRVLVVFVARTHVSLHPFLCSFCLIRLALVGIRFDIGVIAYIHILIDDSICYSAILLFEQLIVYEHWLVEHC